VSTTVQLERIDPYRWRVPKHGGMRTEGLIFADEGLIRDLEGDQAVQQVANVAHLPGIVGAAIAMPDIHWGYGFPIGGVAAFDLEEGVVSPGGVGYDINCGVRLLVAPLSITGAIWYQGEQNSPRGYQYRKILPAMIADWRSLFAQEDLPFYIVSLPAFTKRSLIPVDGDDWTETRESQAITAATVPNSCLAVTIDTGEPDNIHAKDKQPVGERLALCALAKHYGKNVVHSGPILESVERLPDSIRLHFAHTDGGLIVKGDKLGEFSIAGDDRKWSWADARIDGVTVVVSSSSVPHPTQVRYAWQSNPAATLFNGAGLPAVPFRTDTWPSKTEGHRPY